RPWERRPWRAPSSRRPACPQQPSRRSPWGRPSRRRASSPQRASSRQRPSEQPWPEPSSRRRASPPPSSSRQPLVNLLDLHEVGDRADVPAVGRGVLAHDDVADALEAQAAQGVALVLLLADNGLDLGHLETGG